MIERKVTFNAETAAPSPRYLAAGMTGDNHARLVRFDVPTLTNDQMVFVKITSGDVTDKVRLYADDEGMYCWTISENALRTFGDGGKAQVEAVDPNDPLSIRWQSGVITLSTGASVDVDTTISTNNVTLLEQIQKQMQRVEVATAASEQAAKQSEQAAKQSEQAAAQSERNAAQSEKNAAQSERNAADSRDKAQKSEQNADTSEKSAAESARDARRSADEAASTAVGDMDARYLKKIEFTPMAVRDNLKRADGVGSGVDADMLDGYHKSELANKLHTHAILEVTGLTEAMEGKAPNLHTQAAATITEGVLAGRVLANTNASAALSTRQLRNIIIAVDEPTSGVHDGDVWLRIK